MYLAAASWKCWTVVWLRLQHRSARCRKVLPAHLLRIRTVLVFLNSSATACASSTTLSPFDPRHFSRVAQKSRWLTDAKQWQKYLQPRFICRNPFQSGKFVLVLFWFGLVNLSNAAQSGSFPLPGKVYLTALLGGQLMSRSGCHCCITTEQIVPFAVL